jgi:hypothetical protein
MTDLNINVNPYLDKEIAELVANLEKLTKIPAGKFLANLVTKKDKLEDLKLLNKLLEEEKAYPIEQRIKDRHYYTYEEGKIFLGI